jgi:putative Mg2+ transporter-C (MgtC) family protein
VDPHWSMVMRLVLAAALGAALGYEREQHGKPAGVRTYGMVCLGAALFTVVSVGGFASGDPARLAAQIATGIGFIGAGAILHRGSKVEGLTTAAGLWVAAAIGVAVGVGMFLMSSVTTALVFALLRFGPRVQPVSDERAR